MKRKLKQTKKAILSRLYYRRNKLKLISKEYKLVSSRGVNEYKRYFGKKRSYKYISNSLINKSKLVNNEISLLENKLKNYKSKVKKITRAESKLIKRKGDLFREIGNVWNRNDFDKYINLKEIKKVNGFHKRRDFDKIQALSDEMFLTMDSKDIVCILEHPDGSAETFLLKDFENEKNI